MTPARLQGLRPPLPSPPERSLRSDAGDRGGASARRRSRARIGGGHPSNLNTTGSTTSSMADLWSIYRATCNPPDPSDPSPEPPEPPEPCSRSDVIGWATLPVQPVAVPPDGAALPCTVGGGECAAAQDSACRESEPPAGNVACSVASPDTDGDGLPDCECKSGAVLGLAAGISLVYALDEDRRTRALEMGNDYGVSTDLSP
jgi:hypothetical protein